MIFYLVNLAITCLLADAKILEPVKGFIAKSLNLLETDSPYQAMYCYMCIGFWVGLGRSVQNHNMFESAFLTSFLAYVTSIIIDRINR